jgi:hypothetical protein
MISLKKSLKIPESVNRRKDNTLTKRKDTKRSIKHTQKTKDRVTRTTQKPGGSPEG